MPQYDPYSGVCVISYLLTAALADSSGVLLDHILSQIEMIDPSRAPLSPLSLRWFGIVGFSMVACGGARQASAFGSMPVDQNPCKTTVHVKFR